MAGVAFHVVGRLVEVSHTWDVIFSGVSNDLSSVRDDHGCVPQDAVVVALQDGGDDNHVVLHGKLLLK